jgi:PTS system nitrogen regulatory IIA component
MPFLNISELIGEDLIIDDLKGRTKLEVLQEFSALLSDNGKIEDKEGLTRVLAAREALGSTGIGDSVAIPHGKLRGINGLVMAFGRSIKGVEYDSLDGEPAHLFFLVVAPEDAPGEHLKALARISRLMKKKELRESLLRARDRKGIKRIISSEESGI